MGRYYSGDIDGKFWFALQSSDCADRFGSRGHNNYLEYYFDESHLPEIRKELTNIENSLGDYLKLFKKFFEENNGYNDEMLFDFFKKWGHELSSEEIRKHLEEYADYGMGQKILKCVEENNECSFTAEI